MIRYAICHVSIQLICTSDRCTLLVTGLPDKADIEEYRTVCCATEGLDPQPMTRLVALLANDDEVGLCLVFI